MGRSGDVSVSPERANPGNICPKPRSSEEISVVGPHAADVVRDLLRNQRLAPRCRNGRNVGRHDNLIGSSSYLTLRRPKLCQWRPDLASEGEYRQPAVRQAACQPDIARPQCRYEYRRDVCGRVPEPESLKRKLAARVVDPLAGKREANDVDIIIGSFDWPPVGKSVEVLNHDGSAGSE